MLRLKYNTALSYDHPTLQQLEMQHFAVLENWFYALAFYNGYYAGNPYPYTILGLIASPPASLVGLCAAASVTLPQNAVGDWYYGHGFVAQPNGVWLCNHLTEYSGAVHVSCSFPAGATTSFTGFVVYTASGVGVPNATVTWGPYATTTSTSGQYFFENVACGTQPLQACTQQGACSIPYNYTPPCDGSSGQQNPECPGGDCPEGGPGEGQFEPGDTVQVVNTGGLGLRAWNQTCSGGYVVKPDGATGTIVAGPECCGGYIRWQIQWSDDQSIRWSAEGDAATGEMWLDAPSTGSVVAWGSNVHGQCNVPAPNSGFVAVAGGEHHSLGLTTAGSVLAWGSNSAGQCNVPVPNNDFVAVAAGRSHSLALRADGSVVAWGWNGQGQTDVPPPNTGFVAVAAGQYHSLALRADGSILAWGWNAFGQTNVPVPNAGYVGIAAGYYHSLGLKADGSITAWGSNQYGQNTSVPAPNSGFVAVAAGWHHSLGLKVDGSIVAWGNNCCGQTDAPTPNSAFVSVAAGSFHSLALHSDGSIYAWGWNVHGQCNVPEPNVAFVTIAGGGGNFRAHSLGIRASAGSAAIPGNCNGDLDSNLLDYAAFPGCASGPTVPSSSACGCYRFDDDSDVDLRDFAALTNAFTGG